MNPVRKIIIGGALAAATVTGGAIGATVIGTANAATTPSTAATATPAAGTGSGPGSGSAAAPQPPANMPPHGSAEHEAAEKPVTGDNATKAQAAAVKSLGGGTAGEVTTDYPGTGYEVTVTKADGTKTEVHLDSSFNVMQGPGGPHGPGGPRGNQPAPTTSAPAA